jgi:glycolate oxidase FAD binding subunit
MGFTERSDDVLLIKFDGSKNGVEYQAKTASAIIGASPGSGVEVVENDDSIWHNLASMPIKRSEDIILRISVKPADLETLISELKIQKLEHQISIGTGYVRVFAPSAHPVDIGSLRRKADQPGGSLIIENAPPEIKKQFDAWGDLGSSTTLMERIKQQLDPDRLLSPGRFSPNI